MSAGSPLVFEESSRQESVRLAKRVRVASPAHKTWHLPLVLWSHALLFLEEHNWTRYALVCQDLRRALPTVAAKVRIRKIAFRWNASGVPRSHGLSASHAFLAAIRRPVAHWTLWHMRGIQSLHISRGITESGLACIGQLPALESLSLWLYETWGVRSLSSLRSLAHLTALCFCAGPFCALDFRTDTPRVRILDLSRWNKGQAARLPSGIQTVFLRGGSLASALREDLSITPHHAIYKPLCHEDVLPSYIIGRNAVPWDLLDFVSDVRSASATKTPSDDTIPTRFRPCWNNGSTHNLVLVAHNCRVSRDLCERLDGKTGVYVDLQGFDSSARRELNKAHLFIGLQLKAIAGEWIDDAILLEPEAKLCLAVDSWAIIEHACGVQEWQNLPSTSFYADVKFKLVFARLEGRVFTLVWRLLRLFVIPAPRDLDFQD